jgi:stage II sporulation protein D
MKIKIYLSLLLLIVFISGSGLASSPDLSIGQVFSPLPASQVKVRLFTNLNPYHTIFTVNYGQYLITNNSDRSVLIGVGESVIIARFNNRIFLKLRDREGFISDSVFLSGQTGSDLFSLRVNEGFSIKKNYSGDLKCFSDMQTLLLINTCEIEQYIAGVVMAEGGSGKSKEYTKTQAIIARTYTYKYYEKHIIDGYNLCDDTHCQAYNGLINDSLIFRDVLDTKGLVITTPDSLLIISAFHSNCGGETCPSEYAWTTVQPYLIRVLDPYCRNSRNSLWERKISIKQWMDFLQTNGFAGSLTSPKIFTFDQPSRIPEYMAGTFSFPLRSLRTAFDLKSSFFSVSVDGDSLQLKGRGYGHGVGLCQEGAMNMALKGFTYQQIINFYYFGVLILDIKNAVLLPPNPLKGALIQPRWGAIKG